ncbi:hypothetical protein [Streptomyces sp. NBC_00454]|uniref:hypothetical protein n=1 Tax=Streptomyces sp. NBC_00454 TaxID=2975747 RepID=UPI0030E18B49
MLKKVLVASLLTATAAMGAASPAMAAEPAPPTVRDVPLTRSAPSDGPAAPRGNSSRRCSYGLLFNDNRLTCDYAQFIGA